MPDFLSPEWVEALDRVARRSSRLAACSTQHPLVLEQRVQLPSGAEHAHHIVVSSGAARVCAGRADHPDVVLYADLETARDVALGTLNAQRALTTGRLRVQGNVNTLVDRSEELGALDDVFVDVRAVTTFPAVDDATVTSPE